MSKTLLSLLVLLPIALGAWMIAEYGLDNDGVALFAGVLMGSVLTGCWSIFGRHYKRVVEHHNGLMELQLRLDRVWSAAGYNGTLLQNNHSSTAALTEGKFGKMLNQYAKYEDLPDETILKIANNDFSTDLMALNKVIHSGRDVLQLLEDMWSVKVEPYLAPSAPKIGAAEYESTKSEFIRLLEQAITIHNELMEALDDRLADARILVHQRDWLSKTLTWFNKQRFRGDRLSLRRREIQVMKGERDKLNKPFRRKTPPKGE